MDSARKEFKDRESYENEKQKVPNTKPSDDFEYPNRLSATDKYKLEWNDLSSLSEDVHLTQLRHLALNGGLKVSKFRSICWSLLLGVLTGRSQSWVTQRRCDRNRYAELMKQFYINPRMSAEDDPLSQSEKSIWNQHFCDKELCTVIKQDVVRTFPGIEFFRKQSIQDTMTSILFCYARINPEMCYRQGMHEILAPILFVMHCDQQAFLRVQDLSANDLDLNLKEVLDPKYLEADSYFIFNKIMLEIEPFYRIPDIHPTSTGYFPSTSQASSTNDARNVSEIEVVRQLDKIRDKILAKADNQLHNHLLQLDIPLPLFGIRWLRLLFGREFAMLDLLLLWDAIFAIDKHFELTKYIVVAMLISIREEMLHSDYTTGLSYLMKYPSNIDVMSIIRHSLHLYAPETFERTANVFTHQSSADLLSDSRKLALANEKSATLPRNMHSKAVHQTSLRQQHHGQPHSVNGGARVAHTSHESKSEQMHERINQLQNSTAKAAIRLASHSQPQLNQDPGIVEGYLENSPEVLKLQLQNAHTVMTISRLKLMQYLAVFRKHIPGDSLHELHQTMDGIEELCELLKIKQNLPYVLPAPVEPAFEANEAAASTSKQRAKRTVAVPAAAAAVTAVDETPNVVKIPVGSVPPLQITTTMPRKTQISDAHAKREFVRTIQLENQNFEIKARNEDVILPTTSSRVGLRTEENNGGNGTALKARYEIPDDCITRTAAKIIGNRKELEMREFLASRKSQTNTTAAHESNDAKAMPIIDPSGERQSPSDE